MNKKNREIRITNVPNNLHDDLKNIAQKRGVGLSQFLKPQLRELANKYMEQDKSFRK